MGAQCPIAGDATALNCPMLFSNLKIQQALPVNVLNDLNISVNSRMSSLL